MHNAGISNVQSKLIEKTTNLCDQDTNDYNHKERIDVPEEGLVESDYEVEDEQLASNEPPTKIVNLDFDFKFSIYDRQEVRYSDTDYQEFN